METKQFYRYESVQYGYIDYDGDLIASKFPNPSVELRTFNLFKETPKGYWIGFGYPDSFHSFKKWVSKTSVRRYAYPTKEEALNNFIKRNEKRISILKYQLESCEIAVSKAKILNEKEIL